MDVNIALREKLSNLKSPHVLRNHRLPWPIFESNFENWCQVYDEHLKEEIRWDVGVKKHHDSPYWERYRTHETMTMQEFRQRAHNDDKWYTYSYKDIETWPEALREKVDFTALGFEEAKDILFWIGSRGANTPCHYDTYGFNIVVQVFGRKRWLLFPPDTPIDITRVPYEESSVYCKQNFYSPKDATGFSAISDRCHEVTLLPGDILIVPNRWWHYVECLDEALAINTWIPMEELDARASLEECLVKNFIVQTTEGLNSEDRGRILNPNETTADDLSIGYPDLTEAIGNLILDNKSKRHKRPAAGPLESKEVKDDKIPNTLHSVSLLPVDPMPSTTFNALMVENGRRYHPNAVEENPSDGYRNVERLINAMCHPTAIRISSDLYLNALEIDHRSNIK